jgi:acetolactate synthase-1/2/3 large subunit
MVRQWQESFYGNRFSNSYMKNGMPNFAEVAKAYSLKGITINNFENNNSDQLKLLLKDLSYLNECVLVDVKVIENENCYPMVAPGRSNSQMLGLEKQTSINSSLDVSNDSEILYSDYSK